MQLGYNHASKIALKLNFTERALFTVCKYKGSDGNFSKFQESANQFC